MVEPGWMHLESPFHTGEIAIQAHLGVRERLEQQGRRMIRDYLPDQHRQFYAQLPFLVTGTVDGQGHPWASILVGAPGFLSTPDEHTLRVEAHPLPGDPLIETLAQGTDIGLLGIELPIRRRNRANGTVATVGPGGFEVAIAQSFGNCPQYIQARMAETVAAGMDVPVHRVHTFGAAERTLLAAADTFFIATAFQGPEAGAAGGVDVSHRGGKPGFVRVDDGHHLTFPDFSGNLHFNTLGNLALNPYAGLLFLDFARGGLLYLTGTAEVLWEGEQLRSFAGAERLVRFWLAEGFRTEGSLPLRWSSPEYSPYLERTGKWPLWN